MKTLAFVAFLSISHLVVSGELLDLENLEIPSVDLDDFAAIKERCDKTGGLGTYDKLKASKESLRTCITQFANVTAVREEVEEAKKTGSMDEVFGKYCNKRPKLASCVQDFTDKLRPCLNSDENKALNTTLNVLKQLGDFVCYRDGDRIALFIAEGGVECIQSHIEGIKSCVNSTFKVEPTTINTNSLPTFVMDKKKCDDLGKLQNCVVEELEKCQESTPANIVDALFKFVKRSACPKKKRSVGIYHNIVKRNAALINSFYDSTPALKTNFLKAFKTKCSENVPDGGYEAFTLNLESATHCIRNKTRDEPIFVTPAIDFKANVNRCVWNLIEKTQACLPENEKYWPKFYLDIIQNLIDFLYDNKDILLHISTRAELMNCFQNFKQNNTKKEVAKCFEVPEINSLRKDVVCWKLTNIKDCVSDQVQKKCIRDVAINKLTNDFFKAIIKPCKHV
ncbi:uncharacterized protein LOC135136731 [Zophobas morio]|uniref:uncharacterized protein LOC135136731 n=1 Tax=Zophobas morio TaxID=2755281 RepID=UPI003083BAA1